MSRSPICRSIFKPVVTALATGIFAGSVIAAPTWPDASTPNREGSTAWRIAQVTERGTVRLSNRVSNGSLHAVCSASECNMFVEPDAGCLPGSTYPLLVNSPDKVGVIASRCMAIHKSDGTRLVVHLAASTYLVAQMIHGADVSIGFPTQRGQLDVLNIRMKGAGQLLARALLSHQNSRAKSTPAADAHNKAHARPTQAEKTRRAANAALRAAIARASTSRHRI